MTEDRFSCFLARMPMPIAVLDRQFRFLEVNELMAELDGISAEGHLGKTVGEILPDLGPIINPALERVLAANKAARIEVTGKPAAPQEEARHWLISCVPVTEPPEVVITFVEVTGHKRAEQALERASVELDQVATLDEMVQLLHTATSSDEANRIIARFIGRLFPLDSGALCTTGTAKNFVEVIAAWGDELVCKSVFAADDCRALRDGRLYQVNASRFGVDCSHVLGGSESVRLCVPMTARTQALGVLHLRKTEGGFTESHLRFAKRVAQEIALALGNLELREAFRYQALRDPLTGLYNRRYLEESLDRELRRAARKGSSLGLMMVDIDHFKQFNDAGGHAGGDLLLRKLGKLIASHVRAEDITCRYGGDEFSLVVPDTSLKSLHNRADELRRTIRLLLMRWRRKPSSIVTVSIGVAVFPDHGLTFDELVRAADAALYSAKAEGRDRVKSAELGFSQERRDLRRRLRS